MPRLRNPRSGVVVDVDDTTAAHLGRAYEPIEVEKRSPARRAAKKASVKVENSPA